jgi:hypothetical protein
MSSRNRTPAVTPDMMTGTRTIESQDAEFDAHDRSIVLEGDLSLEELRDNLNSSVSMDTQDPAFLKYTADSAFMEEEVLVFVHQSTDPNAEKIVEVFCNGTPQRFPRGQWTIARRKYVGVLAHAKPFNVSTPETTDGNGDRTTKIEIAHGLRYPFEIKDRNPIGQAWLNSLIAQP